MTGLLDRARAQDKAALLLALVASDAPAQELRARVRGLPGGGRRLWFFRPYPLLRELEGDDYVRSYEGAPLVARGGGPRRYYQLTAAGHGLLQEPASAGFAALGQKSLEPTGRWRLALADDPRLAALGGVVAGIVLTSTVEAALRAWGHAWPVALVFLGVAAWVLRLAGQRFFRLRHVVEPEVEPPGCGPTRQLYLLPSDPEFVARLELLVAEAPEHSGSRSGHAGTVRDTGGGPSEPAPAGAAS